MQSRLLERRKNRICWANWSSHVLVTFIAQPSRFILYHSLFKQQTSIYMSPLHALFVLWKAERSTKSFPSLWFAFAMRLIAFGERGVMLHWNGLGALLWKKSQEFKHTGMTHWKIMSVPRESTCESILCWDLFSFRVLGLANVQRCSDRRNREIELLVCEISTWANSAMDEENGLRNKVSWYW